MVNKVYLLGNLSFVFFRLSIIIERQAQLVRPHFYIGQDFAPDRVPMQRVFTAIMIIRSLVPRSDNSSIALSLKGGLFVRRRILKGVKTTNIGSIFETKVSVFGRDWPLFTLY